MIWKSHNSIQLYRIFIIRKLTVGRRGKRRVGVGKSREIEFTWDFYGQFLDQSFCCLQVLISIQYLKRERGYRYVNLEHFSKLLLIMDTTVQ